MYCAFIYRNVGRLKNYYSNDFNLQSLKIVLILQLAEARVRAVLLFSVFEKCCSDSRFMSAGKYTVVFLSQFFSLFYLQTCSCDVCGIVKQCGKTRLIYSILI